MEFPKKISEGRTLKRGTYSTECNRVKQIARENVQITRGDFLLEEITTRQVEETSAKRLADIINTQKQIGAMMMAKRCESRQQESGK